MPRHHFSPLFWIITLTLLLLLSPCQRVSNLLDDESAGAATPAPANQDDRTLEPESTGSETAEIDPAITEDPEVATLPELAFVVQNVRQIPAQGEAVSVESGVSVQLSPESLAPGVEAELSQWDIGPEWRQALERNYTIETPFVSLAATGTNDGVGRAVLNMPAASPDSRLAVVIDNTYFSLLDITPTGGHLETAVRLGPSESGGMEQVGSLAPGGSLQLAVLTPKSTAATDNRRHFGKPATQVAGSCGIDLDRNFGRLTHCRHSADGTVQVNFLWNIGITDSDGDQLADAAAKALARYRELGFTAANITPRSPMEIIVETRTGDPQYRSINGVIYLPVDAAKAAIAGTAHDTLHEMAH